MTILEKIIAHKHVEIAERSNRTSLKELEQSEIFEASRASFVNELKRPDKVGVIAEFKRRSPSKGTINALADISEIAAGYEKAGASAISVLTDENFFGGSNDDLTKAFRSTACPILRKDFIIGEYQIVESRAIGASAILLIAAFLSSQEIKRYAAFAASLELDVLLEVHDASEIPEDFANVAMIGVNNRDLRDFSVDINRSIDVAKHLPDEIVKVSESGLSYAETIIELKKAGFNNFLIGETFMRTADPAASCANFIKSIQTFER